MKKKEKIKGLLTQIQIEMLLKKRTLLNLNPYLTKRKWTSVIFFFQTGQMKDYILLQMDIS